MNRPFNIFPSDGYKNSQFQILSRIDNLEIALFHKGELRKVILTSQESTEIIQMLEKPGVYTAKCNYQGEIFEQDINVRDAFRLGSSEFKKAFVFDDSEYSFFLMKDRLLLYNEEKNILYTENHYSPTEILQIDKAKYLFLTKLGAKSDGIVNLGIYSTDSFSILGELLNDFQTIHISPETNKVWLFQKSTESIHCFELINTSGKVFNEIRKYENASEYRFNSEIGRIAIDQEKRVIFIDINNLNRSISVAKTTDNAVDRNGYNFVLQGETLKCTSELDEFSESLVYPDNLNLVLTDYLYVGENLQQSTEISDFIDISNKIKSDLGASLPEEKTFHKHLLQENEVKQEVIVQHYLFPTLQGIYIIKKETERQFIGVNLRKVKGDWQALPRTMETSTFSMVYANGQTTHTKVKPTKSFRIKKYHQLCLIVDFDGKSYVYKGKQESSFSNECTFSFHSVGGSDYLLIKQKEFYTIYETLNLHRPILDQVTIHNVAYIDKHKVVWYSGEEKNTSNLKYLNALDLSSKLTFHLDEKRAQYSLFKDASSYEFNSGYILSSSNIIIDPKSADIKDSFIGNIETYSTNLSKIVSQRINHLYLSNFNISSRKFEEQEIQLDTNKFKESYLSPNGQFLVLQNVNNQYLWYDIEKNETVRFISGKFLAFSKEGNLIIEQDETKAIKIYDPITFSEITPPNYHHYRFLSPDGKLYSHISIKTRFLNKLNGNELNINEFVNLRNQLESPIEYYGTDSEKIKQYERDKEVIDKNRHAYFLANKSKFDELGIEDHSKITLHTVVKIEKFTEIGIVGTNITTEVLFPEDLAYYNYAAFSYDNKYFGYVGKPSYRGLIHLYKLDFDEQNKKLSITDTYLSRFPNYASWVCGFSRTGYFATYDSTPDTYLIYVDDQLFDSKIDEFELGNNIYQKKYNIYHSYNKWNEIKGKNFLCFSPTGEYLALSEQGYEPLTLGGYGHQESSVVHVAETKTGRILYSFSEHGSFLVNPKIKDTIFVSFSEDEKRLMSMSKDGVVLIRDIELKKLKSDVIRDVKAVNNDNRFVGK